MALNGGASMANRYVVISFENGKDTGSYMCRETYEEAETVMLNIVSTISESKSIK